MVYDLKLGEGTAFPKVRREQWIDHRAEGGVSHRYLTSLAISPDGQRIALNDQTTPIQVINVRDGRILWEASAERYGSGSLVTALSFSPDGRYVVSGDTGGEVRLWDAESGDARATAPFTRNPIAAVGFYPDAG